MSFTITTDLTGEIGVNPRLVRIVSTDNYDTVISLNYLSSLQASGVNQLLPTDFVAVSYNGGFGWFSPTFTSQGITLTPIESTGNVILPVISGHFANFSGTDGLISDQGYLPSNTLYKTVSTVNGSTTPNDLATFADTSGSIHDSGFSASNSALPKVVMMSGTSTINNIPVFFDASGSIQDSGARIISGVTASFAGGSTSNSYAVTGLTSTCVGSCVINSSTNAVSIVSAVPGTNLLTVSFSADPGAATTVTYIYTTASLT